MSSVPAYAVAWLRNVTLGPQLVRYLDAIDATLAPFGGSFLIHGATPELLEGSWCGDLVVLRFPDRARAASWYRSAAYQALVPLRQAEAEADVILVDGVPPGHRANDILPAPEAMA